MCEYMFLKRPIFEMLRTAFHQTAKVWWTLWLVSLLSITLSVWLAYARILDLGFTGWDTLALIETNRIASLPDLARISLQPLLGTTGFYRPLSQLSFAFDDFIWGLNPVGYHLTDISLHLAVCLGVTLLGYFASGKKISSGWLCGIVFALHPALATVVLTIPQRMDVLMTLGIVWSLLLLYSSFQGRGWQSALLYFLSLLAFVLAIGAKETGWVALPLLCLLCFAIRWHAGWLSVVRACVPYFLLGIAFAWLYRTILSGKSIGGSFWDGMNLDVSYIYLVQTIVPNTLKNWSQFLTLLFLGGALVALIQARSERARLGWLVLFALWAAGLLLLYLLVGIDDVVSRYAYALAAAVVLFVGVAVTLPRDKKTVLGFAMRAVLLFFVLVWLATSPWFYFPQGAIAREQAAADYLVQFDNIISETSAGATIDLENVPPKLVFYNGIKIWLGLKWASKHITLGTQTQSPHARGHASLSVDRNIANGRAIIHAVYDRSSSEEE